MTIDFADNDHPVVEKVDFDFASAGHALCIIDSGADHADLTDEYSAVPGELKKICARFGKGVLREVPEADFFASPPAYPGARMPGWSRRSRRRGPGRPPGHSGYVPPWTGPEPRPGAPYTRRGSRSGDTASWRVPNP